MIKLQEHENAPRLDGQGPFYIVGDSSPARPRCTLKQDYCFAILDNYGDIGSSSDAASGFFYKDTRYLSRLTVLINKAQPLLLGSTIRDDNLNLRVDLTNPDSDDEEITLLKDTIHIARLIYLHRGALRQRHAVTNHGSKTVFIEIGLLFDSDFADLFEIRGMRRPARGTLEKQVTAPDRVLLRYTGLDRMERSTALSFNPAPDKLSTGSAQYFLKLEPGEVWTQFTSASGQGWNGQGAQSFLKGLLSARRDLVRSTGFLTTVETSNALFNEVIGRSLADLRMLMTKTDHGEYPYAGIPWYSTAFGRDGLITAMQMLWLDPGIAKGVLSKLAAYQADAFDPDADAQPGKILHELRHGEMAALGEVPFGCYYGSVDSTPLFVLLAGLYVERTGNLDFLRFLWPHVERGLDWIDGPGDPDGDGFIEYGRSTEKGLVNQGWKDSHDAIFHANGDLAEGPIALVEVQAYVYAAKLAAARCARRLGLSERADELTRQAELLRQRFEDAFWCEDLGTYAVALDGKKRLCRVRTSNPAHALFTKIMTAERARLVAGDIARPSFNSGWGVRTVAMGEARYNPMSYHNGSVWPHDNAMIAWGLAEYGFSAGIAPIFNGVIQAAEHMDQRRIQELYCGFPRRRRRGPTLYPVACSPQAWASGAVFHLLQAVLGLHYDVDANSVTLRNPVVPSWVGDVTVRKLKIGNGTIDFAVKQSADGSPSIRLLDSQGELTLSAIFGLNREQDSSGTPSTAQPSQRMLNVSSR